MNSNEGLRRDLPLTGSRALITGASRGIGRAIAFEMALAGAEVAICSRSQDLLESLSKEISEVDKRAIPLVCDVTDPWAIERTVGEATTALGGLDVLVNNAGGNRYLGSMDSWNDEGFTKALNLNLLSAFRFSRAASSHLKQSGDRSSIINVGSVTGLRGSPNFGAYSVAKAGIISMTQTMALELAKDGIRVNAIAPGWIDTDLLDWAQGEIRGHFLEMIPMGRFGSPREVALTAVFLASPSASYITGHVLHVDGGMTA